MERRDFKESIDVLKRRRRYRNIDGGKLLALMERADFTPPPLRYDAALERIKRDVRSAAGGEEAVRAFPRFLRPAMLLPAAAAALVVAMATPFIWSRISPGAGDAGRALCSFTYGDVSVARNGVSRPAARGAEMRPGDMVVTGENSFADLGFGDDVKVRVKENTRLSLGELARTGGGYRFSIDIPRGTALFNFKKLSSGDSAIIGSPTVEAVVRGTSFGVMVDDEGNTRVEVRSGKVGVRHRIDGALRARLERAGAALPEAVVEANRSCAVSRTERDRVMASVAEALRAGAGKPESIAAKDAKAPAVADIKDDARMLGDVAAFSRAADGSAGEPDVVELSVDVTPEGAAVYLDGDYRGRGDITLLTGKGAHTIVVKADNHADRTYEAAFTERRSSLRIELESVRTAPFNFRKWASSRDSSLVAYMERDGILINVGRNGLVETIARGSLRWSTQLGSAVTAPLVWDQARIYLGTSVGVITALDRDSGRVQWNVPITGHLLFGAGMEIFDGHLYAGTSKGHLYKISTSGRVEWEKNLGSGIFAPPFAAGGRIIVTANDGMLYQVNAGDGSVAGSARIGKMVGSSRVVRGDMLYMANMDGEIICYDYARNRTVWRYATGARMGQGPMVDGEGLIAHTVTGDVHRVDFSGERKWMVNLGNRIEMNPLVKGGEVFIISDRVLYVLDRANGGVKWSYVIDARPTTSPVVASNRIMFGAEGRGLVVLKRD
ncbi:MAG TPA: PQQ-binding-like beta-propeller repeat protein [Spirochaetota bacterium]|nr:PQQ-binding-like beta-propeller repeat protein [Spirochaetota bacterium]